MQNTGSRLFWALNVYFLIDFKTVCGFLRLLDCKRMIRCYFTGGVSEHGDMQTGSFLNVLNVCTTSVTEGEVAGVKLV